MYQRIEASRHDAAHKAHISRIDRGRLQRCHKSSCLSQTQTTNQRTLQEHIVGHPFKLNKVPRIKACMWPNDSHHITPATDDRDCAMLEVEGCVHDRLLHSQATMTTEIIIIVIITRFSCLEARWVCRQAAVKAFKILPLVGLARSKQDPINRGHGAQYYTAPRQPGPNGIFLYFGFRFKILDIGQRTVSSPSSCARMPSIMHMVPPLM